MKWRFILEVDPIADLTETEFKSYCEAVLREQWGFDSIKVLSFEDFLDSAPQ